MRSLSRQPVQDASYRLADMDYPSVAHGTSPSLRLKQWSRTMRDATETARQNVGKPRRNVEPREVERRMSDAALDEGMRRYPFHTDKLMARDAGCSPEAMQKARERGKLSLRHVIMLAITWGPDFWRAITETADERLAECLRLQAEAQEHLAQGYQHTEDDSN